MKAANTQLEKFSKLPDNQICFDCGKRPAPWASFNNAIFLCLECSGDHRGYGVNISSIRSVTLDKWNDTQIRLMLSGGNTRLGELLQHFEIGEGVDPKELYRSKLLDFYRKSVI